MSLPVILRPEAEQDIESARAWFEQKQIAWGDKFAERVTEAIDRIAAMPEMYAVEWRNVRACRVRRYPFVVYYRVLSDRVEVLAVLHGSRDESVWKSRA